MGGGGLLRGQLSCLSGGLPTGWRGSRHLLQADGEGPVIRLKAFGPHIPCGSPWYGSRGGGNRLLGGLLGGPLSGLLGGPLGGLLGGPLGGLLGGPLGELLGGPFGELLYASSWCFC